MSRTIALLTPGSAETKTSTFPQPGRSSDASGARPYLAFDASADEAAYWTFIAPVNLTTPLTLVITYAMASATANNIVWDGAIEAVSDGDSMDTDTSESLDTANTATAATVPGTAGNIDQVAITLTTNDSIAAGDMTRVRIRRVGSSGSDTATGDAFFLAAELRDAA